MGCFDSYLDHDNAPALSLVSAWGYIPSPYLGQAALCPMVGQVGACCKGCADGKTCGAGKKEDEKSNGHVGQVGTRAVPFSKASELNSEIIKLRADIGAWAVSKVGTFAPDDSAATVASKFPKALDGEFFLKFRSFVLEWDEFYIWRRDNPPPWYSPIPSAAMTEAYGDLPKYDALLGQYESLLAQFVALGGKPQAVVPDQRSPFEQGVTEGGEDAGKAFGAVTTALTIAAYVIGGGVVLYLGLPLLPAASRALQALAK